MPKRFLPGFRKKRLKRCTPPSWTRRHNHPKVQQPPYGGNNGLRNPSRYWGRKPWPCPCQPPRVCWDSPRPWCFADKLWLRRIFPVLGKSPNNSATQSAWLFNFKYYEAVLVKLYTLAIIINEDLLVNELKDFNSLIPLLNNKEEVDNEFKKLLLNNPQLFYTIYLMNICIDIDSNFFLYNFQFNIIDKKYIDLYQYLTNQNTHNLMIELIKNTSINWSLDFNWKKYGFVWLQYYLLNTKDDVDINQMIDINNKIHDYHIITFILMNYSNFIIVPKIIPFKDIEVLHKEKFHLNELIKNDVNDIFKNEIINNKLQLKIGEVYYQYDLYTNKISHIYALDLYESYGALE
ncbi:MAG: hypothetical protein IIT97_02200 [Mycoplasmataceae bacterium]|nr:hypothetical protein [Mycoplasmataceae bacterium]